MHKKIKSQVHLLLRSFWASLLTLIIAVAVVVQLGRAAFPILDDYQGAIAEFISDELGAEVTFSELTAAWQGLTPEIMLTNLQVRNQGAEIFSADEVELQWSLLATLGDWRDGLRKLRFKGLRAVFVQNEQGRWHLQGLPGPTTGTRDDDIPIIDDPVDIFVFGRRLELIDTQLRLRPRDGADIEIAAPSIQLENDNQFHRLAAELAIAGEKAFTLVVEGNGDPRDEATFIAKGHLQSEALDLARLRRHLVNSGLLPEAVATTRWLPGDGDVQLSVWFNGTTKTGVHFLGQGRLAELTGTDHSIEWPKNVSGQFRGFWQEGAGWQVALRNWQALWPTLETPLLDVSVSGGGGREISLNLPALELAPWAQAALHSRALPPGLADVLTQLAPAGGLTDMRLNLTDKAQGYFHLHAHLERGAVNAWQGAPAITGARGWLQANALGGWLRLASDQGFSMAFPTVYDDSFGFESAHGDLRWQLYPDRQWVGVSSGRIELVAEDFKASGHLNLRLPTASEVRLEPEMTLVLGVEAASIDYHRLFVPRIAPEPLRQWLNDALLAGWGEDLAFIYHGTLLPNSQQSRAVQLFGRVKDAELKFHPQWPRVSDLCGKLWLDDERVRALDLAGTMLDNKVVGGQVHMQSEHGERKLEVQVQAEGQSAKLLRLLLASPAGAPLQGAMGDWRMAGNYQAQLALDIPLQRLDNIGHKVQVELTDNELRLSEPDLLFKDLRGVLRYSNTTGLHADKLAAKIWGEPVDASITTLGEADRRAVHLSMNTLVSVSDLRQQIPRPELAWLDGASDFQVNLQVPFSGATALRLEAKSALEGVAIRLPEPLGKASEAPLAMTFLLEKMRADASEPARSDYQVQFADQALLHWRTVDGDWLGGALSFYEPLPEFAKNAFLVSGSLPDLEGVIWFDHLRQYLGELREGTAEDAANPKPGAPAEDGLSAQTRYQVDLNLAGVWFGPARVSEVKVNAQGANDRWSVNLENDNVKGGIQFLPGDAPLAVDLEYLRFPGSSPSAAGSGATTGEGEKGVLQFVPPERLAEMDVTIAQLALGGTDYGRWRFKLRPVSGGVTAYDLFGELAGAQLGGAYGRGAQLVWLSDKREASTYVSGQLSAADIGQAAEILLGQKVMTSTTAKLAFDLQWPGPPDQIALATVAGEVDLEFTRGRFIRGVTAGEGPLVKLMGLFNFDTLARRLRLDFSDLNPEGMAYEKMQGQLLFTQGEMEIREPLQVETPSANLQFVGDIDLVEERLDAELIATLPLAGNLTVAAALTGGIPTAITVYVLGKLFKKQMNRASSVRYNIDGNWSDPNVSFDRIFEDTTSKKSP